jgi:hypothetical protein
MRFGPQEKKEKDKISSSSIGFILITIYGLKAF